MDIYIKYCDAVGQYDSEYNKIVEWKEKECCWVVLPEYNDYNLVYAEDENGISDIPRACHIEEVPDCSSYPDIILKIQYDYNGETLRTTRYWGDLFYSEEEAIEILGETYVKAICKMFSNIKLEMIYNDKIIWNYA